MKSIDAIEKNQVVLLVVRENANKTVLEICKKYSGEGLGIVTASNPAGFMLQALERNKIESSKIMFIDCSSGEGSNTRQIVYTSGPDALTELSISISQLLGSDSVQILLLDSISSLLIHNEEVTLARFLHDMVNKAHKAGKKLAMIILKKDNKGTLASVPLFCDAVVEVD
ncbi:MAG TPA: hypothetical protein HA362_02845 [Nanoarchaeota archaeon]|nr:hypothetical protein [Nanoarchaeota archaeon]